MRGVCYTILYMYIHIYICCQLYIQAILRNEEGVRYVRVNIPVRPRFTVHDPMHISISYTHPQTPFDNLRFVGASLHHLDFTQQIQHDGCF